MSDPILDPLDVAINRVANRLVSVKNDPYAVQRIVASLPARRERGGWSWSSWRLQAVAFASVLLAFVYTRMTNDEVRFAANTGRPDAILIAQPMDAVTELHQAVLPVEVEPKTTAPPRTLGLAGISNATAAVGQSFGLPLIVAPDTLSLPMLQTAAPLATIEPATVAPIALIELPLSVESPPPSFKE